MGRGSRSWDVDGGTGLTNVGISGGCLTIWFEMSSERTDVTKTMFAFGRSGFIRANKRSPKVWCCGAKKRRRDAIPGTRTLLSSMGSSNSNP